MSRDQPPIIEETDARFSAFVTGRLNPGTVERDRTCTPFSREELQEAAKLGLLGYNVARELGGEGRDLFDWGTTLQRLGYLCTDSSFPLVISLYSAVLNKIAESESAFIRDRYLGPLLRGEMFASNAFSDGNDVFAFKTKCRRLPDGSLVVSGRKPYVTGALMADVIIVYAANESNDLSAVLVERSDPGVRIEPIQLMGMRAAGLAEVVLDEVHLPAERVLVKHDALSHGQRFLNDRRLVLVSGGLGAAERLLEECVGYLEDTIRYGRPLSEMQNVQASVGHMAILLSTSKMMSRVGLERLAARGHSDHWDAEISTAKYQIANSCVEIANTVLHVTGGAGYGARHGFERVARDFMGLVSGAGSQDTLQVDLGINYVQQLALARRQARRRGSA